MIYGDIRNLGEDISYALTIIQKAVDFLRNNDLRKMDIGRHEIDGERMYCMIAEYQTKPKAEKQAEQHRKYIDVHYILSGREFIGAGFENPENKIVAEYNEKKECTLYSFIKDEIDIALAPGKFVVLFPTDIHRPGCILNKEELVKKAIIKIVIAELNKQYGG